MSEKLSDLDLAALLSSRLCHDLISPVGAINNGLEVLAEENSEEMRKIAHELIRKSARQASAKLQFARIAFGAAGSAGAEIDLGDAEAVARGYFEAEKSDLVWRLPRLYLPKNRVKLLLNLLLIGLAALPRGGTLEVEFADPGNNAGFVLRATGPMARLPATAKAVAGAVQDAGIDAHNIQPVYTRLLAEAAGLAIKIEEGEDLVTIRAI